MSMFTMMIGDRRNKSIKEEDCWIWDASEDVNSIG